MDQMNCPPKRAKLKHKTIVSNTTFPWHLRISHKNLLPLFHINCGFVIIPFWSLLNFSHFALISSLPTTLKPLVFSISKLVDFVLALFSAGGSSFSVSWGSMENRWACSVREGKGKSLWKKVKYQLVEYNSLPGYLRDNEYIVGHYRSGWPMKQVLLSIFSIHNETLNVWTHLIGFFLFLSLTIYTAMKAPRVVDPHSLQHFPEMPKKADMNKLQAELLTCLPSMPDLHRLREEFKTTLPTISSWHVKELLYNCLPERLSSSNHTDVCSLHSVKEDVANIIAPLMLKPISRLPFFSFLGGAMFCLLVSSVCHLVSCHSERLSYIMLRLDYTGIASLICTSFFPPVYYSFMCHPFLCNLYLGFITLLGIAASLVSLLPFFQKPKFRSFRASLFCGMGLCGAGPILHKLYWFWGEPDVLHTTGYEILMGLFYGAGALVYATRIPERWMPGKFDIAGHSHQLFHVLVVAGAYTHYRAGLIYLRWRDLQGC